MINYRLRMNLRSKMPKNNRQFDLYGEKEIKRIKPKGRKMF